MAEGKRELYHCMYREPQGAALLASCFRDVNGEQKNFLFAATHLTKALAFAFSYHDNEVLFNSGIEGSPNEIVLLCGGQATLDKPRHIKVFAFPDDGFAEIPRARQAVSENPVPFSQTRIVLDTTDINDLMKSGLQIFVLPEKVEHYEIGGETMHIGMRMGGNHGEVMGKIMQQYGARWINQERGIGVCPLLASQMGDAGLARKAHGPDLSQGPF